MHDALVMCSFLTEEEGERGEGWERFFGGLTEEVRAAILEDRGSRLWIAAERSVQMAGLYDEYDLVPPLYISPEFKSRLPSAEDPLVEVVRSRL